MTADWLRRASPSAPRFTGAATVRPCKRFSNEERNGMSGPAAARRAAAAPLPDDFAGVEDALRVEDVFYSEHESPH